MTEQQLRDFGDRAEQLVPWPEVESLHRRGRRLRRRRRAVAGGVLSVALLASGAFTLLRDETSVEPVAPLPDTSSTPTPYPSLTQPLTELDPGVYELPASARDDGPVARLTVPGGWNAWYGPNRFEDDAYVGVLVLDVARVVTEPCQTGTQGMARVRGGTEGLVRLLSEMPRMTLTGPVSPDDRFGHPATHLRLRATGRAACPGGRNYDLLATTDSRIVWALDPDATMDVWAVDVEGFPVLIMATRSAEAPRWMKDQLNQVVDSTEFVIPR